MYENQIRRMLPVNFPQVEGYFQAADIVSQVLNFGLSAMIDVQISGFDLHSDYAIGRAAQGQAEPDSGPGRSQNRRAARLSGVQG